MDELKKETDERREMGELDRVEESSKYKRERWEKQTEEEEEKKNVVNIGGKDE